jgi:hypothetical protein
MERANQAGAADWILDRLHPFARDVGSFVPVGFAAYARILHPAWRTAEGERIKVRWAHLAREKGGTLEAVTRIEDLTYGGARQVDPPLAGSLELDELNAVVDLLGGTTTSQQLCWFGWWEGFGWMPRQPAAARGGRVEAPNRPLVLYRGAVEEAAFFSGPAASQSPTLWWPDDRAWCIASEIDHHSTYLGGSEALVHDVLHDQRLEAVPVDVGDRVSD